MNEPFPWPTTEDDILYYYDGPQLFVAEFRGQRRLFIALALSAEDETNVDIERYGVSSPSEGQLNDLINDRLDLRDAMLIKPTYDIYGLAKDGKWWVTAFNEVETPHDDDLPEPGIKLHY